MEPYVNSIVKEEMRKRNEQTACSSKAVIEQDLQARQAALFYTPHHLLTPYLVIGGIFGAGFAGYGLGFPGFFLGLAAGIGVWCLLEQGVKKHNANINRRKQQLAEEAQRQIQEEFSKADQRTLQEAAAYDREVKMYAQKVLAKAESIRPMVDSTVDMFQRMISHADAGSSIRFIQADFTYLVMTAGIKYSYSSQYTNPQDDFNFNL